MGWDIWGPINVGTDSKQDERWILTLVDWFHGYVRFFPLHSENSSAVVHVLIEEVLLVRGCFHTLMSDSAANFRSAVVEELCERASIRTMFSAANCQYQNGRTEIVHQLLNVYFKSITAATRHQWAQGLKGFAFMLNQIPSTVSGVSANEVEFGSPLLSVFDANLVLHGTPQNVASDWISPVVEFATRSREVRQYLNAYAGWNATTAREAAVARISGTLGARATFAKGSLVSVYRQRRRKGLSHKFLIQWEGPFVVVSTQSDNNYHLRNARTDALCTANISQMCTFTPTIAAAIAWFAETDLFDGPAVAVARPPAIAMGSIVATMDQEDDSQRYYWLNRVMGIEDDVLTVHRMATSNMQNPRFLPVWLKPLPEGCTGYVFQNSHPAESRHPGCTAWEEQEELTNVLAFDVALTAQGMLTAASKAQLKGWRPCSFI